MSYTQSQKILSKLKEKAQYVKWSNNKRKEHFGIIAKKIENKEELTRAGFLVYDLDDWK